MKSIRLTTWFGQMFGWMFGRMFGKKVRTWSCVVPSDYSGGTHTETAEAGKCDFLGPFFGFRLNFILQYKIQPALYR